MGFKMREAISKKKFSSTYIFVSVFLAKSLWMDC
jgi:hypothetical protein